MRLPESLTGLLHAPAPRAAGAARAAVLGRVRRSGGGPVPRLQRPVRDGQRLLRPQRRWPSIRALRAAAAAQSAAGPTFTPWPFLLALAVIAVAVLAAWWLAGRFLRPLRAMTTAAQEISATNLDRRLSLDGPDDELTELGRTLDDLFGRLQASFESQRQFVANASHELRTPLAGQRTLLQVALADPDADAQALRSTCEEALQLSGQQERLIDALLTLATSERGVESWEPFDLAQLTQDIVDSRRHDAERHGVQIDATFDEAHAIGDAEPRREPGREPARQRDPPQRRRRRRRDLDRRPRPTALACRSATPEPSSRPSKWSVCSNRSSGSATNASARPTATVSASRSSRPSPPPTAPR